MSRKYISLLDRILARTYVTRGCWYWLGRDDGHGRYGRINIRKDGKHLGLAVHRVVYELFYGPIPNGLQVCHNCFNHQCVNPEHLRVDTLSANLAERRKYKNNGDDGEDPYVGRLLNSPVKQRAPIDPPF